MDKYLSTHDYKLTHIIDELSRKWTDITNAEYEKTIPIVSRSIMSMEYIFLKMINY